MYKVSNSDNEKINPSLLGKYTSYLDWIELVYQYNKEKTEEIMNLFVHNKIDLMKEMGDEEREDLNIIQEIRKKAEECNNASNIEDNKKIQNLLWKYKYIESSKIPTKTSVTKLKELEKDTTDIEELIDSIKNKHTRNLEIKPKFIEETQNLTAAQKGTVMHLCVQKLKEQEDYTVDKLYEFVQDLEKNNIISEKEAESVNIKNLYKYTQSDLWKELKEAKEIHKEEPFYINIPAISIYDGAEENEQILVQGIIDLYYINKEGKLILVDYKTDRVPNGDVSILEEKYKIQLDLYKRALEEATGKKVNRAMIFALSAI